MSVKKSEKQNNREVYKVIIRKDSAKEDYEEMVAIQENSMGKKRFIVCFEDFNENEMHEFTDFMIFDNYFRNTFMRKTVSVRYAIVA